MRKRILSLMLCCVMLLGLMPTTAFAEDSAEEPPVCICETACTVDNMNKECPVCGAKNAIPQNCGQYIPVEDRTGENSSTEGADDPNGLTELGAADQVQAMIDDLPGTDEITDDNAEEVEAQLEAIDEAKEKLSDEEIDELDMTRYAEAAAALGALAAPMLLANGSPDEQFSLTPGGRYYFDLSGASIPGTANSGNSYGAASLPDTSLHYVPFTYVGTVDAYKLTSAMATTEEYAQQNKYAHSLFVADYAVTHTVSWDDLNTKSLIFGKAYASGGVDYTLRAPSVGSNYTGDFEHGMPQSNEWDMMLGKNEDYIKNWICMGSLGQDTSSKYSDRCAARGYNSARYHYYSNSFTQSESVGFRPVLEVLNADTLGSDGLKVVTLDLGGGTLGGSSDAIQIIVKNGSTFTAPMSGGLTRPDGDTGSYFVWLGSDGKLYAPGASVPADVTKLTAQFALSEQFSLKPGGTYYFDLSGEDIPGDKNGSLPDGSLHWVPFTYAGTVNAYVLKSRSANDNTARGDSANAAGSTDPDNPIGYTYDHSLFIADYNVTRSANWHNLNAKNLIFGKAYTSSGVDYTLRAPSAGSSGTASGGTPASNEWDAILDKANQSYQDNTVGYIKNWNGMDSWGQDTHDGPDPDWNRATRGSFTARSWQFDLQLSPSVGFRPVLELPSSDTLGSDDLTTVTLNLNGGSIGTVEGHITTGEIHLVTKKGESYTAPSGDGLTRPDGNDGTYFMWQDSSGNFYEPGDTVPAGVGRLTAIWEEWTKLTKDVLESTYKAYSVGAYLYRLPRGNYYLGEDISVDIGIDIGTYATPANVTLDLNGHELKDVSNNTSLIYFPSTSSTNTLTLMDSSSSKTGKVISSSGTAAKLSANAKLNANGGTIEGLVELVGNTAVIDNTDPLNVTVFTGWVSLYGGTIKGGIFTGTVGIESGTIADSAKVTVTFNSDGGSTVAEQKVLRGQKVSEPTAPTKAGYSFEGWYNGDTKYDFTGAVTENITLTARWKDSVNPVITGLENNKTYCDTVEFEVSDNVGVASVQVDGVEWTPDANGKYTLAAGIGDVTVVVTDHTGNPANVTVTVNNGHTYEWQSENGQYWKKCKFCNDETAKKDIPTITINGADSVCRTQDYKFSFTLPEGATDAVYGYEFENKGDLGFTAIIENNEPHGVVSLEWYEPSENSFKVYAGAKTADGFDISASKVVSLKSEHTDAAPKDHICDICGATLSEHAGGEATCKDKAVCEYCRKEYGELAPNSHADLKHFPAKAATKTAEGNIEYWYCSGCGKYYKDAKATQEITKTQTVTAKLPDDSKSPQTGDNSNLALWIALLFVSGGAVTATTVYGRKKKRLTK